MENEEKEPHCNNENCKIFHSCKNLWDRFKVTSCIPNRQEIINKKHQQELKTREEMLRGLRS